MTLNIYFVHIPQVFCICYSATLLKSPLHPLFFIACLPGEAFYSTVRGRLVLNGNTFEDPNDMIVLHAFPSLQEQYGTMVAVFSCGKEETTGVVAPFLPLCSTGITCEKFVRSLDSASCSLL